MPSNMESFLVLLIVFISHVQTQHFTEESPFMRIRLMDLKLSQWKPDMLNTMEKALDAELKYSDEKKGIACESIDFEQELGYPKQAARFLDLSIRGICTDEKGKHHTIEKDLITKAIIRRKNEVNAVLAAVVFRIGNVQLYERNRNHLNFIIIPAALGFIIFLFTITFLLRRMRDGQKRRHIMAELLKKRQATERKIPKIANTDTNATDIQSLLQLDASGVVDKPPETIFSSKQTTTDASPLSTKNNQSSNKQRDFASQSEPVASPVELKENRSPYYERQEEVSFRSQPSGKSYRERVPVPFESGSHYSSAYSQNHHEPQRLEMVPMHEPQPRVVVRSICDDDNYSGFYRPQQYEGSSSTFVSIPIQIEESVPHQRYVSSTYHSDPYYSHAR